MNRSDPLTDELIQAAFERRARRAEPVGLREDIVALTATSNQPAAWRLRLANAFARPAIRPAWVALLLLAALLGIAVAVTVVGQRPPPIPSRTSLLAYTQDGELYLANADGSQAMKVPRDSRIAFSAPTWSPDDRWLALESDGVLLVLDPATLEMRRFAAAARLPTGKASTWSADSRSIAFIKPSLGRTAIIQIADVATGAVRELQPKLTAGASLGTPLVWSPDGRWLLARVDVASINAEGARFVRIDAITGDTVEIAAMHHLAEPGGQWSSDSRRFAFARTDPCDNPPCRSSIVVEDADLSRVVPITDPEMLSRNPIWSPNDAWIAFTSELPAGVGPPRTLTLSIVRPDGRDMRVLTKTAIFAESLSWNADGTKLTFLTADPGLGVAGDLAELRVSDGVLHQLALSGGVDGYDWQTVGSDRSVMTLPTLGSSATLLP